MTLITDPLFYVFAVPAVVVLGISKGGFSGIGMVSTPLLALVMPPLQAAAILLPIILLQDALSCWIYRREWDRLEPEGDAARRGGRRRRGLAVRGLCVGRRRSAWWSG